MSLSFNSLKSEQEILRYALRLLHSSDKHSDRKLRELLDFMINKTFGIKEQKNFKHKSIVDEENDVNTEKQNLICKEKIEMRDSVKALNMLENVTDENDVPRISIPDEESVSDIFQICDKENSERLILYECERCQKICYPISQEFPFTSIDNSRSVWLCKKCTSKTKNNL